MADKSFGVKELNLLGSSGTPSIESPNDLNLNANTVAISTNLTVGGKVSVTSAGIVTAVSGVVTYYGDGQYLSGTGGGGGSVPGIDTTGTSTFEDIVVNGNAGIGSLNVTGVSTFVGRVGIGTIPGAKLHISGPAEIRLNNAADAGNFARILCFEEGGDNAANLAFHVGTGEVLRIDNDGNVGIGTSVPTDPVTSLNTTQLSVGIVSATSFYGSGENLTGIVTSGGLPGIDTTGTSTFENIIIDGNASIGSLNVTGISTFGNVVGFNSTLQANWDVTLGTDENNTVTVNADFNSDLNPSATGTYDLGHGTGFWKTVWLHNIYQNSAGFSTFSNASFSGNVSIGGTLTYEDVTNVDSIGIITAREGIRIGAGKSIGSDGAAVVYYGDGSKLTLSLIHI